MVQHLFVLARDQTPDDYHGGSVVAQIIYLPSRSEILSKMLVQLELLLALQPDFGTHVTERMMSTNSFAGHYPYKCPHDYMPGFSTVRRPITPMSVQGRLATCCRMSWNTTH